jgi:hypothetical protein
VAEERTPVVVGLLASPGLPRELAENLVDELPEALGERFEQGEWRVLVDDEESLDGATTMRQLKDVATRRRRSEGWDFVVCLTDVPLRSGRRPVTAHASAHHRVGLLSVPALGAIGVEGRVRDAVIHLIEGMLGEGKGRARDGGRQARLARRLEELTSPLGRARVRDEGTIRFTTATIRGNLRLILGMVRANDPSLVVVRLSRALAAALGTAALSLTSVNVWLIADGSSWPRLLGLSLGTVAATCAALIVAHHLWERADEPDEREQVIMFNLATLLTVLAGVATLYVALFVTTLACAGALIPSGVLSHQVGRTQGVAAYVQLAWLVASLATIGGGLGSVIESDLTVHEAMYRYHPDERTENPE